MVTSLHPCGNRRLSSCIFLKILSLPFSNTACFLRAYRASSIMSYQREYEVACLAVQRACILTQLVFKDKEKETLSKDDKSPVTIGDFGAQSIIISAIHHLFPQDQVVGEEDASSLRENNDLADRVWSLVQKTCDQDHHNDPSISTVTDKNAMLDALDAGKSAGGPKGRMWTIDPIDGTKGFLRGGQYAVCAALIEDGDVKVGVLGCPNLPRDMAANMNMSTDGSVQGIIVASSKGSGAYVGTLGEGVQALDQHIRMRHVTDIKEAIFCESVEAGHSSHGDQADIATRLGIVKSSVRMDSQAKYASIARGAGDIYLRLPVRKDYEEKIWDHAAGDLIVREAGGEVTDVTGKRLDFSQGRTLKENKGVVAASKAIFPTVLEAVQAVVTSKEPS